MVYRACSYCPGAKQRQTKVFLQLNIFLVLKCPFLYKITVIRFVKVFIWQNIDPFKSITIFVCVCVCVCVFVCVLVMGIIVKNKQSQILVKAVKTDFIQ